MAAKRDWTAEEDEVLRTHYPAHGQSWDGWAELLPGRTTYAIQKRASSVLGVTCTAPGKAKVAWTPDEDMQIRKYYPTRGPSWDGWTEKLPGRDARKITYRAGRIGVRYLLAPKGPKPAKKKLAARQPATKEPERPQEPATTSVLGHRDATWTEEQREALLRHMVACVNETGHPIGECLVETARIIREGLEGGDDDA